MTEHSRLHTSTHVGVAGMGTMGQAMARTLVRAGFSVSVFNRTADKCRPVQELGAAIATSVAGLAAEVDVLLLMLSDDAAVNQVVQGDDGILACGAGGLLVVNSSTVHPATSQELAQRLAERGIDFLDAPVTGSLPQAETGQLYFLVGGTESAYLRGRPLFEALGKGYIHLGPVGSGSCAKLGNNMMAFANLYALAEALAITGRFGVAPEDFLEAVSNSGGRSAASEAKGPKILQGNWSPDFALKLAAKDLRLVEKLARDLRLVSPFLRDLADCYSRAAEHYGESDVCRIVKCRGELADVS